MRAELARVDAQIVVIEDRWKVPVAGGSQYLADWQELLLRREALEFELRTVLACG
jgi:hypothetical protein